MPRDDDTSVVVGVDGSANARHAFHWAIEEARVRGARVRAVHAWEPPLPVSPIGSIISPYDSAAAEQAAKRLLESAVDDVLEHSWTPAREIEPVAVRGYASRVLVEQVRAGDLLVVGSRGRGGFAELLLGSVSQHCVAHAHSPVAVVPAVAPLPDAADVVVGIDGSEGAKTAVRFAIAEAAIRGARLVAVNAWWGPSPTSPLDLPFDPTDPHELLAASRKLLQSTTDELLAEAERAPRRIELLPVQSTAAKALLDQAARAGLLVVGSRGLGGFAGMVLGSVSQQCIHHAPCAVVVVPEPASGGDATRTV